MNVVNTICNKVAVMDAGRIAEQFSLGDLHFVPQSNIAKFLTADTAARMRRCPAATPDHTAPNFSPGRRLDSPAIASQPV
jgi:ABC-type methionine transport system ATPase subunit